MKTITRSICSFRRLKENKSDDPQISKQTVVWINFPSGEIEEDGTWLQTTNEGIRPTVTLQPELSPTDGFVVYPVNDTDLKAPFQIVSVAHTVREFILLINTSGFCSSTAVQTERIIRILKD